MFQCSTNIAFNYSLCTHTRILPLLNKFNKRREAISYLSGPIDVAILFIFLNSIYIDVDLIPRKVLLLLRKRGMQAKDIVEGNKRIREIIEDGNGCICLKGLSYLLMNSKRHFLIGNSLGTFTSNNITSNKFLQRPKTPIGSVELLLRGSK